MDILVQMGTLELWTYHLTKFTAFEGLGEVPSAGEVHVTKLSLLRFHNILLNGELLPFVKMYFHITNYNLFTCYTLQP